MDTLKSCFKKQLNPEICNSIEFFYDEMESQSDFSLPVIYQPFDVNNKSHWRDRGFMWDFLYSIDGMNRKILDFGPGDGWPSLIIAPFVDSVTSVDGSLRRVQVCRENAMRLGITNAEFIHVKPGEPLPFNNGNFDGVVAASSIEQTPEPKSTLRELYRVLRFGAKMRIYYEALEQYRNGREIEYEVTEKNSEVSRVIFYDRDIDEEQARMYSITFKVPFEELKKYLSADLNSISHDSIINLLENFKSRILRSRICTLKHPSGKTLVNWMREIGFAQVIPSLNGGWFADMLFDGISGRERPEELDEIDEYIKPGVKRVVEMEAPIGRNPLLTGIKYGVDLLFCKFRKDFLETDIIR